MLWHIVLTTTENSKKDEKEASFEIPMWRGAGEARANGNWKKKMKNKEKKMRRKPKRAKISTSCLWSFEVLRLLMLRSSIWVTPVLCRCHCSSRLSYLTHLWQKQLLERFKLVVPKVCLGWHSNVGETSEVLVISGLLPAFTCFQPSIECSLPLPKILKKGISHDGECYCCGFLNLPTTGSQRPDVTSVV